MSSKLSTTDEYFKIPRFFVDEYYTIISNVNYINTI